MIRYIIVVLLCLWGTSIKAQETEYEHEIKVLESRKLEVEKQEKSKLKEAILTIEERQERGEISKEEAENLKIEAAKKHALNIENRVAILNNQIALLERNKSIESVEEFHRKSEIEHFFDWIERNADEYDSRRYRRDRRTHSDVVLAFGLNNAIIENESLNDSPYEIGGSRFFEIGLTWTTRVFENTNAVRFKYGFAFQFNGLNPKDNQYFVNNNGETVLEIFPSDLDKVKLRMDNLVVPVHFEFGPSRKIDRGDYFRYSTHRKFKVGVGAYAGFNLGTRQKLKYNDNGEKVKEKIKNDYNTNNFIYGLSAYAGIGDTSLYLKYDLNPLFNNATTDQRNISLGLRIEL